MTARQPLTATHAARIAATKIGIAFAEYWSHAVAGERWCCACRTWHPSAEMNRRSTAREGIDNICREANRAFAREGMRRLAARRRAEAAP